MYICMYIYIYIQKLSYILDSYYNYVVYARDLQGYS